MSKRLVEFRAEKLLSTCQNASTIAINEDWVRHDMDEIELGFSCFPILSVVDFWPCHMVCCEEILQLLSIVGRLDADT